MKRYVYAGPRLSGTRLPEEELIDMAADEMFEVMDQSGVTLEEARQMYLDYAEVIADLAVEKMKKLMDSGLV